MNLTIGWLYPILMSTYGDRGNILCLEKRAMWRGIEVKTIAIEIETPIQEIESIDLIVGGGAQDRQQEIVMRDLKGEKGRLIKQKIEDGLPGLFTCGSPQLLGNYYEPAYGQRIGGLGIFDMYSVHPGPEKSRCIGNVVVQITNIKLPISNFQYLVGFENHGGRTYLGENTRPLGKVIKGFGNNGEDKTEGAVYKNAIATYLHGPILPKNPFLADYLLTLALEKKYGKKIELMAVDDNLENKAHEQMSERILK